MKIELTCKDCMYYRERKDQSGNCYAEPPQWLTYQNCVGEWISGCYDLKTTAYRPACRFYQYDPMKEQKDEKD